MLTTQNDNDIIELSKDRGANNMQKKRGPGRPPAGGRKRDKSFRIFLTTDEKDLIKSKAEIKGKSMVDYLIDLVKNDK